MAGVRVKEVGEENRQISGTLQWYTTVQKLSAGQSSFLSWTEQVLGEPHCDAEEEELRLAEDDRTWLGLRA